MIMNCGHAFDKPTWTDGLKCAMLSRVLKSNILLTRHLIAPLHLTQILHPPRGFFGTPAEAIDAFCLPGRTLAGLG